MTEHEHDPAQPVDHDGPASDGVVADGAAADGPVTDEAPAADETATPDVATAAFGAGDEPVDAPADSPATDSPATDDTATDGTADQATDLATDEATDQATDASTDADRADGSDAEDEDADVDAEDGPTSPSFETLVAGGPGAEPAAEPVVAEPVVAGEPVAGEPVADESVADEPVADEPVAAEPEPVVLSGPPSQRLVQLGIALPQVPAPVADYVPAVRSGAHVYTSGQLPFFDGQLTTTGVVGDEAVDVTPDEAAVLARQCALNAIAAVASVVDLDSVVRVVKVTGFVASAPGFAKQPVVVNGASALIGQVFGDAGKHARSAVGVAALPLGAPVEVELVVEVG